MQIAGWVMPTKQMVTEEDYLMVKDAVKKVKKSLFMPDHDAILLLYKFYKRMNPRQTVCFTCGRERAKVLKYCERFLETWLTNQ